MSHDEMAAIMGEWNKGELDSFLIEISANILKYKDTDGEPLVEKIRDAAGQKGTGKWTAISALGKIICYALKKGLFIVVNYLKYWLFYSSDILQCHPNQTVSFQVDRNW